MADIETKRAEPYQTLDVDMGFMSRLRNIIADQSIILLVVGLPRNLEGDDSAQTKLVRTFAAELGELTGLPVILQDEALTSEEAKQRLRQVSQKEIVAKRLVDQVAASIILQDYLDTL